MIRNVADHLIGCWAKTHHQSESIMFWGEKCVMYMFFPRFPVHTEILYAKVRANSANRYSSSWRNVPGWCVCCHPNLPTTGFLFAARSLHKGHLTDIVCTMGIWWVWPGLALDLILVCDWSLLLGQEISQLVIHPGEYALTWLLLCSQQSLVGLLDTASCFWGSTGIATDAGYYFSGVGPLIKALYGGCCTANRTMDRVTKETNRKVMLFQPSLCYWPLG